MNNWLKTCNISGWITINHQPEPMSFLGRLPLLSMIHCCVLIHLHTPTQHEKILGSIAKPWWCVSSRLVLHFRSFLAYLWSYPHRFGQNPHLLKHDPLLCEISSCCAAKAFVNCLCGHRRSTQTAWCSWDLVGQNCSNKSLWLMPLWGFGKSSKGYTVDSTHSYKLTLILIDNNIQCHAI
jgi:hypothetical protein